MTKYQRCYFIIQIHKFTFKIDTISISLLFECVKIVEFNFNSYLFLVMYQEIRLLNQDACFLDQEERLQFLISSVSERDWKRPHRLELKRVSIVSILQMQMFALPFAAVRGLCERKYWWWASRISSKTSRVISTHLADDVWLSCIVGPGESTYAGFGTFNAGNGLQITITCNTI